MPKNKGDLGKEKEVTPESQQFLTVWQRKMEGSKPEGEGGKKGEGQAD